MKRYIPGELIKFAHDNYNTEIYRVIEYTGKIDSGDCYEFTAELVINKNRKKPKIKKRPLFAIDEIVYNNLSTLPVPDEVPTSIGHVIDSLRYAMPTSFAPTEPTISQDGSLTSAPSDIGFQLKQLKPHTFWDNGDFVRARSQQVLKRTSVIEGDHESRDW